MLKNISAIDRLLLFEWATIGKPNSKVNYEFLS